MEDIRRRYQLAERRVHSDTIAGVNARQKAEAGLDLLKESILDYLRLQPNGARHIDIVHDLRLQSAAPDGGQRNYLSWSVLQILLQEGSVVSEGVRQARRYKLK